MSKQPRVRGWRRLSTVDRDSFLGWVNKMTIERQKLGHEQYGDSFQGDPLDHAILETFDLMFYLWIAKRRAGKF